MHDRVLTANNLIKKNWSCNYNCSLCLCLHETTEHILTQCNYTEATWDLIASRFSLPDYSHLSAQGGLIQWVNHLVSGGTKKEKKKRLGILFTFWWMIWKERNRRIFDDKHISAFQLASLAIDEINLQLAVLPPADPLH
jgi:hypothetical protein